MIGPPLAAMHTPALTDAEAAFWDVFRFQANYFKRTMWKGGLKNYGIRTMADETPAREAPAPSMTARAPKRVSRPVPPPGVPNRNYVRPPTAQHALAPAEPKDES